MKYALTIILLLLHLNIVAQYRKADYASKFQFSTSFGLNIASNKIANNTASDVFILSNRATLATQGLAINYFVTKHFGFTAYLGSPNIYNIGKRQSNEIYHYYQSEFENDYYINYKSNRSENQVRTNRTGATKAMMGLAYRWEQDKIFFKGGLGVSFFATGIHRESFSIKEKNSNHVYGVSFRYESRKGDIIGLAAADAEIAYKALNWLWLKATLICSYDRYHFSVNKTVTNQFDKSSIVEHSIYKGKLINTYLGVGIAIAL